MGHLLTLAPERSRKKKGKAPRRAAKKDGHEGLRGKPHGRGAPGAIVVSRFNSLVTEQLLLGAMDTLRRHGVADDEIEVFRCPGTFELPPVLRRVAGAGASTR